MKRPPTVSAQWGQTAIRSACGIDESGPGVQGWGQEQQESAPSQGAGGGAESVRVESGPGVVDQEPALAPDEPGSGGQGQGAGWAALAPEVAVREPDRLRIGGGDGGWVRQGRDG